MSNQPKHHNHRWKWVGKTHGIWGWKGFWMKKQRTSRWRCALVWENRAGMNWLLVLVGGFGLQILGFKTMDCIFLLMCFVSWFWLLCFCFGMKLWKVLWLQSQAAILVKSMRENTLKLVPFLLKTGHTRRVSLGISGYFRINDLRHTGKIQNEWRSMSFFFDET